MSQHRAHSKDVTRILAGVIAAGVLSIPLAGIASAAPPPQDPHGGDVEVSVNGIPRKLSPNTSTVATTTETTFNGGANVAIARNDSVALATGGTGNKARATNGGLAIARNGNNNTAIASGDRSAAIAQNGDNNTATATCGGLAIASGENQTANDGPC